MLWVTGYIWRLFGKHANFSKTPHVHTALFHSTYLQIVWAHVEKATMGKLNVNFETHGTLPFE